MANIFFAGYYSNDRPLESIANYSAEVVKEKTFNKKYCALTVQSSGDSGNIADSYSEFHNLYGLFKQTKVTFASAINLFDAELNDKEHNIRIKNNESFLSNNLSMFYLGPVGSIEYDGHYKHYVYPLETMFADDKNKYDIVPKKYVAYISQTHADRILDSLGEERNDDGKYDISQYESLLNNKERNVTTISFDGQDYQFAILNIYYESNYYFEGVSEILDDFIAISYYAPMDLRNEQKNIYFLSEFSYQNEYFLKYVNSVYSNGKFNVEINHNNIIGNIDDRLITSYYYENLNNPYYWVVIFLLFLTISMILCGLFFLYKFSFYKSKLFVSLLLVLCLIPYVIFRLIYSLTSAVGFFTYFSCKIFFFAFLLISLILFVSKYALPLIKKHTPLKGEYCELYI